MLLTGSPASLRPTSLSTSNLCSGRLLQTLLALATLGPGRISSNGSGSNVGFQLGRVGGGQGCPNGDARSVTRATWLWAARAGPIDMPGSGRWSTTAAGRPRDFKPGPGSRASGWWHLTSIVNCVAQPKGAATAMLGPTVTAPHLDATEGSSSPRRATASELSGLKGCFGGSRLLLRRSSRDPLRIFGPCSGDQATFGIEQGRAQSPERLGRLVKPDQAVVRLPLQTSAP